MARIVSLSLADCEVKNANTKPQITIEHFVSPEKDRSKIASEPMPTTVLSDSEILGFVKQLKLSDIQKLSSLELDDATIKKADAKELKEMIPFVPEEYKTFFDLRDTDKISTAKKAYSRRRN